MNATGFFKPPDRQADAGPAPVRRRLRRPAGAQQGVLLRRLRGAAADAPRDGLCHHRHAGAAPGHPDRRRPRPAERGHLPGGHGDPDDGLRAQGARGAARQQRGGHHQQLHHAPGVHRRLEQGRRQGGRPVLAGRGHVRPLRHAQPDDRRSAEHPAAVGRRRQRPHLRAQPPVRARLDLDADGPVAARSAVRLFVDAGGQESAGARQRQRPGSVRHPRAADRSAASPAGCPTQLITGYSDLGRQATNPQWQYPTVYNPKINYTWLAGAHSLKSGYEFQHIAHRSAGRESALRPRYLQRAVQPAGRRCVEQPLQPRRLHARPARPVRAQQRARREPDAGTCTSPTSRTTGGSART